MSSSRNARLTGTVIAAHGRHNVVRCADGTTLTCFSRGKKSEAACNDRVTIEPTAPGQGVIVAILPRDNLLYRSDGFRAKMLAANLTRMLIVVAAAPPFSDELLHRSLVAAEALDLPVHIVLNKIDLEPAASAARERLRTLHALGYSIHEISVHSDPQGTLARLEPVLRGDTTVMIGQSGMGKSSLLNLLVPDAQAATREISEALQSGKHTTTLTRRYDYPPGGFIVDTPGFQEFGLAHLTPGQIERAFPEIRAVLGGCRFYNCTHLAEPDCAVRTAMERGALSPQRYALFCALTRDSHAVNLNAR